MHLAMLSATLINWFVEIKIFSILSILIVMAVRNLLSHFSQSILTLKGANFNDMHRVIMMFKASRTTLVLNLDVYFFLVISVNLNVHL